MTNDWHEAAVALKREVAKRGFITIQRDELRGRFGIGRLAERVTEELLETLNGHGMVVIPHPRVPGTTFRVYQAESEIGRIARAVDDPEGTPETSLADVVALYERARAGIERRSVLVPWLVGLEVFLNLVIGRPAVEWEDLDDDREPYQLLEALSVCLGLGADLIHAAETMKLAAAVCACRPRVPRWQEVPTALDSALAEAERRQREGFHEVIRAAAQHLLAGEEIPAQDVDLGRLGLRYRREAKGGA